MKKITFLVIALISSVMLYAQQYPVSAAKGNATPGGTRDNEFQCLPNSVFSQIYPTYNNNYFCDNTYGLTMVADDYVATGPFSSIRFWGANFWGCATGTSQTFTIDIYNGNPSSGGVVVNSFTKTVAILPLGIFTPIEWGPSAEIYQIDIDFGTTVTQLNGWISIGRINPGDDCIFGWTAEDYVGGNSMSYDGSWIVTGGSMFFCLGTGGVVPLSNWALIFGVVLIGTFVFIRYRRMV